MRLKLILLVLTAALALTACESKQPLVSDTDSTQPVQTEQTTVAETTSQPSAASSGSSLPDTAKWAGWGQPYPGGSINLLDAQGKMLMPTSQIAASQPVFTLSYRFDLDGFDDDEVQVYIIAAIGGEVCDLELAGEKSTGGMLHTKRNVNTELSDELVITDCELEKGENELCIMYTAYYPQLCAAYPTKLPKTFSSDCRTKQSKPVCRAQRYEDRFVYSSEKRDLSDSSDFVFDRIGYDQQKAWSEVNAGTDVSLRLINIDMKMTGTVKRNMLIFAMLDDKPIRLAGEKEFAFFRLEKTDCSVKIPLTKLEKNEKPRVLIVCCFDMSEAVWCLRTEHMFLVK